MYNSNSNIINRKTMLLKPTKRMMIQTDRHTDTLGQLRTELQRNGHIRYT